MNITPLLILFIIVPILAVALLALNVLLAVHHPDEAKVSAYECGLPPILGQTRSTFQVHFFVVALLFLIFDLEILLLFPIGVTLYQVSSFGFSIAIIFFIVLTIGFVLEIGSGAISLNNLDVLNLKKNKNNTTSPQPQHFSPSRIKLIKAFKANIAARGKLFNNKYIGSLKEGWNLPIYPDHILKLEKDIYVKLFKFIGGFCVFLTFSGIAQHQTKIIFYYIVTYAIFFSLYRLMLLYYLIIQLIFNIRTGAYILRNSNL